MKAGPLRHLCNVERPLTGLSDRGEQEGYAVVRPSVPCSLEPLNGREIEVAHQLVATATHRVRMWGNPAKPVQHNDRLRVGDREFEIGYISDGQQNGVQIELLVAEVIRVGNG